MSVSVLLGLVLFAPVRSEALDVLCDSSFENCRDPLLNLIKNETVAIDVGMWFMEDARFSAEIVRRKQAGVAVRILMDTRSNVQHPVQEQVLAQLQSGGIPMRRRTASGIEHWKIMLFEGQNAVYFGSANFSDDAFVTASPYVNYVDETIWFTDNPTFVNSIKTRFDDCWVDTSNYADYANIVPPLTRRYATYPVDPGLNIPPGEDFVNRTVTRLNAEHTAIDVMMYRIADDDRGVNALLNARSRGVPTRLMVDPDMYRDPTRLDIAFRLDKLYMGGIPMRFTAHQGVNHGKLVLLREQGMTIFGSSNWTVPSANSQHENNYFATQAFLFNYFTTFFDRRWGSTQAGVPVTNPLGIPETRPFVPQPPDRPVTVSPADQSVGLGTSAVKLTWNGGPWGQYYDIYFGTNPNPPLFAKDRFLGPSKNSSINQSFTLPTLTTGTTYYWKIVSKTAAALTTAGNVLSFTTAGAPPPPPAGTTTIVLWTSNAAAADIHGDWTRITDATAAGGAALQNPDRVRAKVVPALASPANYFEIAFPATANVAYHVWVRMRAQDNSVSNDSVHLQFSDSSDAVGNPVARIGTATSLEPVIQQGPSGGPPQGWGWTDNGWGSLGTNIYFTTSASHVIRVQQREDGAIIDQVVISPDTYMGVAPGPHYGDTTILPSTDGSSPPPPPPPPPPNAPGTFVLWTSQIPSTQVHSWQTVSDSTAAGGTALRNPDLGAAKIAPALANPTNYFEASFEANAGTAYHIWIRGRADNNSTSNDSVHIQFSDAVDASNNPFAQIGTASSAEFVLQAGPSGASPHGWVWTDNGWDALGPHIYFGSNGTHTLRVQQREDGITVDQIVLSSDTNLTTAPGARRDDATILPATNAGPPPPPTTSSTATATATATTAAASSAHVSGHDRLAADNDGGLSHSGFVENRFRFGRRWIVDLES